MAAVGRFAPSARHTPRSAPRWCRLTEGGHTFVLVILVRQHWWWRAKRVGHAKHDRHPPMMLPQ